MIKDNENDEITYKPTNIFKESDDDILSKNKWGTGALIFFVVFSLLTLAAAVFIFVTKTNEIRLLEKKIKTESNISSERALEDSEKIFALQKELKNAQQNINNLDNKGKEYSNELSKAQNNLKNNEAKIEDLLKKLAILDSKNSDLENRLSNNISQLKEAKDEINKSKQVSESSISSLNKEVSYWKKKYENLNKEQTDAVNDVIASAKSRQKTIDYLEESLLSSYEKSDLYYSLISWEENYRLTNKVPLTKLTQKPLLITTAKPEFSSGTINQSTEGMVIVKGTINEDGKVTNIEVLYSPQNNNLLAEAAKDSVSKYRYRPAVRDGVSVKASLVIPVEFKKQNNS